MIVRSVVGDDLPTLAEIWHEMWHLAHAEHLPQAACDARTLTRFAARLRAMMDQTRVTGPIGSPTGFCTIADNELYQLFVAKDALGTGAAQVLISDAEIRLASNSPTAFLHCLPENARAIAFYQKAGWHCARTEKLALPDAPGLPMITVARFEKALIPPK